MKIVFLHQYYPPPGSFGNDRCRSVATYWARKGAEVTVVTSTSNYTEGWQQRFGARRVDRYHDHYRDDLVEVHVLDVPHSHMMSFSARVRAFIGFYRQVLRVLSGFPRPDLIYATSTPPSVGEAGRRMARQWNIPFIFELEDVWPDIPKAMGILRQPLLVRWLDHRVNRIYHDAEHIVAFSPGMRDQVISHGVNPDKVMVSVNGTDIDQFVPVGTKPAGPVIVLYAGTIGKANDVGQLVRAAKLLEHDCNVQFHVIGHGNDMTAVRSVAEQLRPGNLTFFPTVPKEEVPRWFAAASIGVATVAPYPVLEANSANKYFDYLAAGLPVVINYGGWQAEELKKYDAGLSSAQNDLDAFAQNIRLVAEDALMRQRMGTNGRQLACRQYDRRMLAEELLVLIERTVRNFRK